MVFTTLSPRSLPLPERDSINHHQSASHFWFCSLCHCTANRFVCPTGARGPYPLFCLFNADAEVVTQFLLVDLASLHGVTPRHMKSMQEVPPSLTSQHEHFEPLDGSSLCAIIMMRCWQVLAPLSFPEHFNDSQILRAAIQSASYASSKHNASKISFAGEPRLHT